MKNLENSEPSGLAALENRCRPDHNLPAAGRGSLSIRLLLTLILLLSTSVGCAYYNTFYYARRYFNEAETIQAKSNADVLSQQAKTKYDQSIEKCLKVIVEHGGGWKAGIDDALFLMGACYYGKREYETAIKKFNELILNYPESEHIEEALFYTGQSYFKLRNVATARRVFARILRDNPEFSRRDEIIISTAESLESENEYLPAARQYRIIIERFKDSDQRELALERMGGIYFDQGYFDSALTAYEELSRLTQDDELYFESQLKVGRSRMRLHDHDGAMEVYQKILPQSPEREENGGRVWLAMAETENRAANHDRALEYLANVSEYFANRTTLGLEADFRIGYTNEVYVKDYAAARQAYEKAVRSTQRSVFKDQAQRRLQNVKRLEALQSDSAAGEEGETDAEGALDRSAMAALQVAEFSYFESDDIGEALGLYEQVTNDYPGTLPAQRAGFARGWILYSELDSLAASATEFERLAESYPASDQAERALELIEEIGLTPPDRLLVLQEKVGEALARERARRDSIMVDSLLAAQQLADSLTTVQAAQAVADSIAALTGAEETAIFPVSLPDSSATENQSAPSLEELRARRDAMRGIQALSDSLPEPLPLDSLPPQRTPTEIDRLRDARAHVDSLRGAATGTAVTDSAAADTTVAGFDERSLTPEQQRERARRLVREATATGGESATPSPATRLLPEHELEMNRDRFRSDSLSIADSLTIVEPDSTEAEDQ